MLLDTAILTSSPHQWMQLIFINASRKVSRKVSLKLRNTQDKPRILESGTDLMTSESAVSCVCQVVGARRSLTGCVLLKTNDSLAWSCRTTNSLPAASLILCILRNAVIHCK